MRYAKYLVVLAIAAGAILTFLFTRRRSVLPDLSTEFNAIDAEAEAKVWQKKLGSAEALRLVQDKYKTEIDALDTVQRIRTQGLVHDPGALARALVRSRQGSVH